MRRFYLTIAFLVLLLQVYAQTSTQITHYSVDDGLSENHVLCMLQDRKGNMWFGTFDGLNKFDGYTFRNVKAGVNQKCQLANSRINRLEEDYQGFLWLQTNDGKFYRFDPSTETYLPVPQCIDEFKNYNKPLSRIQILSDGSIWLKNNDSGNEDCFKVENIITEPNVKITHLALANETLASNKINKIYLDNNNNTWIPTSNGIYFAKKGNPKPIRLFKETLNGIVTSLYEYGTNLYAGGEHGTLHIINKTNNTLNSIKSLFDSNISDIQQIGPNELFLLTNTLEFYIYTISSKSFQRFKLNCTKGNNVYGCYKDRSNNIWIDTDNTGSILFDTQTKTIRYIPIKSRKYVYSITQKSSVFEDKFNNIWVQPRSGGLYKFNKNLKQFESILSSESDERDLSSVTHTAISDKQGNLWLSTYLQGLDKVVFRQSAFTFTKPSDAPANSLYNEIRSITQDSRNWLWVGSKKGLVYVYDQEGKLKGKLSSDGEITNNEAFNISVYDIIEDHSGTLWLATKGMGLFKLVRKSNTAFAITNYCNDPKNIYSISSNSVYSVFEDHLHRIWIGTFSGGLNLLDTSTGETRFINYRNLLKNYPIKECSKVRCITEDQKGSILIGTTQGLLLFKSLHAKPEEIVFERYVHNPKETFSLAGNDVQYILPSKKGDIYLALTGGGINVIKGGLNPYNKITFEILKAIDGTSSNLVYTLQEDKNGCIWMSGQTQIVKYNPDNLKFDAYKPVSLNNYFFDEATACQTKQGEIIYGTSDGFVSFNPLKISKSAFVPRINLTQLQIFNKTVKVAELGSPLQTTIDDTKELILNHTQNIFSIEYAALDYANPSAIQYAYKLDGLEFDWNYVGNLRTANYINLPKGKYTFHVKSTNSDGEWVDNEKRIVIIKRPSFWESNWGIIFYVLAFVLFSTLVAYILFTIYRLRNEIVIEQRLTNMKLRFFTDISHELRTPLTLIASPIDNLLKKEPLSSSAKDQLHIVQRNTNRMLRLINQILDFRKIQNKKMKLIIEVVFVADFLDEICKSFNKLVEDRNIRLKIIDNTNNTQLWIDKDKFEKIFINLLSNAFKFTNPNNTIDIVVSEDANYVSITIRDQGTGISKDKLRLLFDRFESFTTSKAAFQASTGIGLSLTKELVELHHAKIEVDSEYGKGSAFKVTFRKGFDHFGKNDEFLVRDFEQSEIDSELTDSAYPIKTDDLGNETGSDIKHTDEFPKVLIVEDNNELRGFLKSALHQSYEVYEAENGRMALDIALSSFPDIIISDVMMPDMDGLELARAIKSNINISHIPLILLTAKTDIESKLEAMELGVDDYITKPFSLSYLEARVDNLLKIRNQLQSYFKATLISGVITLSKPNVTNLDEVFLNKVMKYMEENYRESEMNIDDIARNAGVSRSSFFKKVKSLTGLAPVDFIREFRIQKATLLIEAGETSISQIAFSIGMNDSRYFSKCFKEQYGINPSEYITRRSNKN